jgi:hypothetical protein
LAAALAVGCGRQISATSHSCYAFANGDGLSLMFQNCEKLRLANRHVVESRQRLESQEAKTAELVRSGEPMEDAATLLEEARLLLRLMERHRDIILWDHARGS